MVIVTNHMLRKKLGEVQQQSQIGVRGNKLTQHHHPGDRRNR